MKISTPLALVLIVAVLLAVGGIGYHEYQKVLNPPPSEEQLAAAAKEEALPFRTEEEWTALEITQFLADLGAYSRHASQLGTVKIKKTAGTDDGNDYTVKGESKETKLTTKLGIWNPATYAGWAKVMLTKPDEAAAPVTTLECAKTLLSPSFATFAAENERISAFLKEHPGSAEGMLEAALLTGTIALNDYSGKFRDVRIPLNRMVAFLAASDALGMSSDAPARQLAEAIRLTLCGQQADALKVVEPWKSDDATLGEWQAVLKLRNTMDWKDGRAAALAGSPARQYEYFRALAHMIDPMAAVEFFKEAQAKPDATYWRIANEADLSVQGGHLFSKPMIDIELKEAVDGAKKYGIAVEEKKLDWLKEYLDTPEGSPVTTDGKGLTLQVAGKNLFGGYEQRHLMQSLDVLYGFLNDSWGVQDAADGMEAFIKQKLPEMRYKPFLVRMIARDDAERIAANVPLVAIIKDHTEVVTPCLWSSLRVDQNGRSVQQTPDFHAWFHPEVPQGTAFETGTRLFDIGVGDENNDPWLKTLWERSPYVYKLAMYNAYLENGRSYKDMSPDIAAKWLGPLTSYDIRAMREMADCMEGQSDLWEESMLKVAALDPDSYIRMGVYFENKQMEDKAAKYFLLGFEKANNRVMMANAAPRLVKYLFKKGDLATAGKVAEEAAAVYSYGGLEAYQWLMEAEGKWDKALETAVKIDERYNNNAPSSEIGCLIRLSQISPEKAKAAGLDEKIQNLFPNGLEKAALVDFTDAPTRGVLFNEASPAMVPFGLRKGMVVVALDGYRTETFAQYLAIRSVSTDPKMSLIVWDGKSYRVSEGKLEGKKFGVDMVDYAK